MLKLPNIVITRHTISTSLFLSRALTESEGSLQNWVWIEYPKEACDAKLAQVDNALNQDENQDTYQGQLCMVGNIDILGKGQNALEIQTCVMF